MYASIKIRGVLVFKILGDWFFSFKLYRIAMKLMPARKGGKPAPFTPAKVKPKTPGDMKLGVAQAKPLAAEKRTVRPIAQAVQGKTGRERIFMIGGREYVPRSVPRGLDRYQAGRLEFHQKTYSELGGAFSNFIRAASRQPLKRAA
jgi:hypothetical protein